MASAAPRCNSAGFTLVELVATLTIAAILAAAAGPRLFSSQPFAARGYADDVASALRQARSVADTPAASTGRTMASGACGGCALQSWLLRTGTSSPISTVAAPSRSRSERSADWAEGNKAVDMTGAGQ